MFGIKIHLVFGNHLAEGINNAYFNYSSLEKCMLTIYPACPSCPACASNNRPIKNEIIWIEKMGQYCLKLNNFMIPENFTENDRVENKIIIHKYNV